jgi:hypothetical protein
MEIRTSSAEAGRGELHSDVAVGVAGAIDGGVRFPRHVELQPVRGTRDQADASIPTHPRGVEIQQGLQARQRRVALENVGRFESVRIVDRSYAHAQRNLAAQGEPHAGHRPRRHP